MQQICAPAASEADTAAISPWMWNSGMMLRQRSAGVSASDRRMLFAEAKTLDCKSGTIFGRDVVPDVWRISATSSSPGAVLSQPPSFVCADSVKVPAGADGSKASRTTATPNFSAAGSAGPS